MNNQRRNEINRARGMIDEAKVILEAARDDEQDYYDNMPEAMQSGEKGERAQAAAEGLGEIVDAIDGFDFDVVLE